MLLPILQVRKLGLRLVKNLCRATQHVHWERVEALPGDPRTPVTATLGHHGMWTFSVGSGVRLPGFKSWVCPLPAGGPQAAHFTAPGRSFPVCIMQIITVCHS